MVSTSATRAICSMNCRNTVWPHDR
jgi:hypothetical protein